MSFTEKPGSGTPNWEDPIEQGYIHVPNGDFEEGSGDLPDDWEGVGGECECAVWNTDDPVSGLKCLELGRPSVGDATYAYQNATLITIPSAGTHTLLLSYRGAVQSYFEVWLSETPWVAPEDNDGTRVVNQAGAGEWTNIEHEITTTGNLYIILKGKTISAGSAAGPKVDCIRIRTTARDFDGVAGSATTFTEVTNP